MNVKNVMLMSVLLSGLQVEAAETDSFKVSGFGSLVAGKTLTDGDVFTADWHDVGQYDDSFSFRPESVFALQATGDLTDKLSFTTQLVAKGVDDFEPEFDWYYLTYEATDDLTLMAGRRTIPLYYFSEFYEVGFAYPWIRPPANLYWWQIQFFDGLHATYRFPLAGLESTVTAFYGNERDDDNRLLTELYNRGFDQVAEDWENIRGVNWTLAGDNFDLRAVYFKVDRDRLYYNSASRPAQPNQDTVSFKGDYTFAGLGGQAQFGQWGFYFDLNYVVVENFFDNNMAIDVEDVFPTILLTATYDIGDYQPYISYSKADHEKTALDPQTGELLSRLPGQAEDDYEQHELYSVGLRYNYSSTVAVKFQYDMFRDQGFAPDGWNFHGDSDTVALAVDFIF